MDKRRYNVFYNLHTVSGITISVVLFVMFFAGAFALFKDEVAIWEKGEVIEQQAVEAINYDRIVASLSSAGHDLEGRDVRMIMPHLDNEVWVILSASKVNPKHKKTYVNVNTVNYQVTAYGAFYSFGEFIYQLHFLSIFPYGVYIAGFIALFFMFAIFTGLIIHWDKIISNFYVFRSKEKFKTIWKDAHTALAMIGLPFQLIFAITSCFLCLSLFVLIPANYFYNNDQQKLMSELRPRAKTYNFENSPVGKQEFNPFMSDALEKWDSFTPLQVWIRNFGDSSMKFQIDGALSSDEKLFGYGSVVYDVVSGKVNAITNPFDNNYLENIEFSVTKLHYADFGGYWIKALYFLMAIITCFVILSGVMIWVTSRDKKNIPAEQKRFYHRVAKVYLAICLSLYPITTFTFLVAKVLPRPLDPQRQAIIYTVFFAGWLLLSMWFIYKRNNKLTNLHCLSIAGFLAIIIPFINGFTSGNWFWKTINSSAPIFVIDALWLILGGFTLLAVYKLSTKKV